MNEPTISKLNEMRLFAMADKIRELGSNPKFSSMNPMDFLAFLVDADRCHVFLEHQMPPIREPPSVGPNGFGDGAIGAAGAGLP